ncbi:MAG: hypothetical protein HKN18_02020 [Silicimonas sp.]|nr:hypothetical protein [Silicimonas sp.]
MARNINDVAQARRRLAEKQKRAKRALQKFQEDRGAQGYPVFVSVRRAA